MTSGRVISQQWMSVDGYAASGDDGEGAVFAVVDEVADARSQRYNEGLMQTVDTVVLGRRTYEQFVQYWPTATELVAGRVNAVPKVVASSSLDAAPWGEHAPARVERDIARYVSAQRDAGATVLVWGSLALSSSLLAEGLIDEFDLFVAPVLLGSGTPVVAAPGAVRLEQVTSEDWGTITHLGLRVVR